MSAKEEYRIYRTFLLSLCLTVALCISAIFVGISIRTRGLIDEENLSHGRAHFKSILMARMWNASYGGVYVEKKSGVVSSPYLENPDIVTTDGRTFTLKAPAVMTREISLLSSRTEPISFHITSLKPLNPENSPDLFEAQALREFQKGLQEKTAIEKMGDRAYYRYMAPLVVEEECLPCHKSQGYTVGDVRGGISVTFDITESLAKIRVDTALVVLLALATIALLTASIWYYTSRLMSKLAEAKRALEERAITDDLTKLSNRRHSLERMAEEMQRARRSGNLLGVIMMDLDRFKDINDAHGHQVGDSVLRETADRLRGSLRPYDMVGRIGGEEFLVVLPSTDAEGLRDLAGRLHTALRETPIQGLKVTASFGITGLREADDTIDDSLRRADVALYRAKNLGRDRVEEEL